MYISVLPVGQQLQTQADQALDATADMCLGQGASQHRIPSHQRLQDCPVLVFNYSHVTATSSLHPQQFAHFRLQAHFRTGQSQRLGSCSHFYMKTSIGAVPRQTRTGLAEGFDMLGDARLLLRRAALGGQTRRCTGNRGLFIT
ncbi:hypothetical protein D3C81_1869240 [compost metagenome]